MHPFIFDFDSYLLYTFIGDIMLVNSYEMLMKAKKNKSVVFHFNINNLEWTKIILEKCNQDNIDVILGVSEGAIKYMGGCHVVVNLVTSLIKDLGIKNNVCLHLDHGSSADSCKKAVYAGFTSVMIDASKYPYDENVRITKEVVKYAHHHNVSVEAEIGHVGGIEDDVCSDIVLADYDECLRFVEDTGVDSLAPAIGTVHGIYKGKLKIDFDLIKKLSDNLPVPLVMHGGSGLSNDILKKAVKCGINKINVNSDLQKVWHDAVLKFINKSSEYDPRKVIMSGKDAIIKEIDNKLSILK